MRKIKKSSRGLTFSLTKGDLIGKKFNYLVSSSGRQIQIFVIDSGDHTISRKKSGETYKPLIDIRSAEVKEIVSSADYMGIEEYEDHIVIHVFRKVESSHIRNSSRLYMIDDVLCEKTAEIVIEKAENFVEAQQQFTGEKRHFLPYYVSSLFSGAGLLDKPFRDDPNFEFVFAADFNKDACETYSHNISPLIQCTDVRNIKSIPDCDLVIGGPCCQAYSNSNRHNLESEEAIDKRLLIDDYIRLVKGRKPSVFVIENVPQILTMDNGIALEKLRAELSKYKLTISKLRDSELGGYTKRVRAIIIGCLHDYINLPEVKRAAGTVRDALSKVSAKWKNFLDITTPSEKTKLLMSYVPQGGNWRNIPPEVAYFPEKTHSQRYFRLSWDEPSPTITNFRKPNITHPEENRILSVAEAAALMGLEDDFPVYGKSLDSRQQQVANGVTQAMAKLIKDTVLRALNKFRSEGLINKLVLN